MTINPGDGLSAPHVAEPQSQDLSLSDPRIRSGCTIINFSRTRSMTWRDPVHKSRHLPFFTKHLNRIYTLFNYESSKSFTDYILSEPLLLDENNDSDDSTHYRSLTSSLFHIPRSLNTSPRTLINFPDPHKVPNNQSHEPRLTSSFACFGVSHVIPEQKRVQPQSYEQIVYRNVLSP